MFPSALGEWRIVGGDAMELVEEHNPMTVEDFDKMIEDLLNG